MFEQPSAKALQLLREAILEMTIDRTLPERWATLSFDFKCSQTTVTITGITIMPNGTPKASVAATIYSNGDILLGHPGLEAAE